MGQTRPCAGNAGIGDVRGPERYLHRYQGSQLVSIWGCLRLGNRESLWLRSMLEHNLFLFVEKKGILPAVFRLGVNTALATMVSLIEIIRGE